MQSSLPPPADGLPDHQAWYVATRWQQLDGEYRANYLRIVSVVCFYVIHAADYYQPFGLPGEALQPERWFHVAVTMIASVWLLFALGVEIALRQRYFPAGLPYLTTGLDLVLLTAMMGLGGGQKSPLVLGYFLILVYAAMRFHLPLLRAATAGAVFAYLYLLVMGRWPELFGGRLIGVVPRYAQLMTLLAIVLTGVSLGQLIRRFRSIAEYYANRRMGDSVDE